MATMSNMSTAASSTCLEGSSNAVPKDLEAGSGGSARFQRSASMPDESRRASQMHRATTMPATHTQPETPPDSGRDSMSRALTVPLNRPQGELMQDSPAPASTGPPRYGTQEYEARFSYEPPYRKPYPPVVGFLRRNIFVLFLATVFLGSGGILALRFYQTFFWGGDAEFPKVFLDNLKLFSVPLVCLLFTWAHVWLALQMMFYPIKFFGIGQPIVPNWLGLPLNGWQGIVPRKAGVMAERACKSMIGNIVGIDEFMDRIQPEQFFDELSDVMGGVTTEVMERIMVKRWPQVWAALPESVKEQVKVKILDDMKDSFQPMHSDIKRNIHSILDIQQMSIDALVAKPKMMVDMFREVGAREFRFIQHVAAVMGFVLGLVQTVLYVLNDKFWNICWFDYVLLPVSGLIIGYFTNWLAIFLTFRPIEATMCCCGYGQIQGVFLKRQTEASLHLARLVCSQIVDAKAMLQYMLKSSSRGIDQVLEIYQKHIDRTIDQTVGLARNVIPAFVGQGIEDVKKDVIDMSIEILPRHSERIEKFIDEKMCVEETLSTRLSRVPPAEFEDIMHPIFKDDEWILLVVGGILGVIIGLLQAFLMNVGTSCGS